MTTQKNEVAPKVSVLVPIYNVEKFLRQCLDSLAEQTLREIEIICINDGSTDSSPEIIREYAKADPRFKVISKKNSGYGDSMNKGLAKATGEYIGIVESDDFIELDAFEKLYALAKEFDADVVRGNFYEYVNGKNQINLSVDPQDVGRIINPKQRTSIFYQQPAIWSSIYRKSFLDEHKIRFLPTPGASYQDTGFNFKVWATTERAIFTQEAFLHYRMDNSNSSVKSPGKIMCVAEEYAEAEKYLRENGYYDELKEVFQAAKFGGYYWNILRLAPELRREFVIRTQKEFRDANAENSLNVAYFPKDRWLLLQYLLTHDTESSLRHIKFISRQIQFKQAIKLGLKKAFISLRPSYRKQLEMSRAIAEIANESYALKQKIRELEEKNEKRD